MRQLLNINLYQGIDGVPEGSVVKEKSALTCSPLLQVLWILYE